MKQITTNGHYVVKATGEDVSFEFEYPTFDSLEDAVNEVGEAKVLATFQRQVKVDAGNTARTKAQIANGHSTRKVMTEEEKAKAKAQRQADKELLNMIKAKGLTIEDIEASN